MGQTTISVRMDDELKKQFDSVCNELGLSMSTAVTILARKMARERRIPFDVSLDPFFSYSNMAALGESAYQMHHGKTITRTLDELDAMVNE